MVTYPFITSINTQIQTAISMKGGEVKTLAKVLEEHWLVVNTNISEGTDFPTWVTDQFDFLPFKGGSLEVW